MEREKKVKYEINQEVFRKTCTNLFSRITDVQDFVARAQRSCTPFILTTSLPFRELNDKELSLEEADLAKAVIVQRPLNTQAPFGHS